MSKIVDLVPHLDRKKSEAARCKIEEMDYPDDVIDVIKAIIEEESDPEIATKRLLELSEELDGK